MGKLDKKSGDRARKVSFPQIFDISYHWVPNNDRNTLLWFRIQISRMVNIVNILKKIFIKTNMVRVWKIIIKGFVAVNAAMLFLAAFVTIYNKIIDEKPIIIIVDYSDQKSLVEVGDSIIAAGDTLNGKRVYGETITQAYMGCIQLVEIYYMEQKGDSVRYYLSLAMKLAFGHLIYQDVPLYEPEFPHPRGLLLIDTLITMNINDTGNSEYPDSNTSERIEILMNGQAELSDADPEYEEMEPPYRAFDKNFDPTSDGRYIWLISEKSSGQNSPGI